MSKLYQIILAEAFGTATLVGSIVFAVLAAPGTLVALTIALGLLVGIVVWGDVSGGHFNPAVTLMFFLQPTAADRLLSMGKRATNMLLYWTGQFAGAVSAAFAARAFYSLRGDDPFTTHYVERPIASTFLAEMLGTFMLLVTVQKIVYSGRSPVEWVAIPLVLFLCLITVGEVSGGAFNPAVVFAVGVSALASDPKNQPLASHGANWWQAFLVYWAAHTAGICLAVGTTFIFKNETTPPLACVGPRPVVAAVKSRSHHSKSSGNSAIHISPSASISDV